MTVAGANNTGGEPDASGGHTSEAIFTPGVSRATKKVSHHLHESISHILST